jgi:hypothetical protein
MLTFLIMFFPLLLLGGVLGMEQIERQFAKRPGDEPSQVWYRRTRLGVGEADSSQV